MPRPRNSLNVTDAERERMRRLFLDCVRIVEIARRTKRSMSVVERAVKGLSRPRPRPKSKVAKRNALIVACVDAGTESKWAIAKRFGITPTRVNQIVRRADADGNHSGAGAKQRPPQHRDRCREQTAMTRAQRNRRDREIYRLVVQEGVRMAIVARRFGITATRVRRIAEARIDLG